MGLFFLIGSIYRDVFSGCICVVWYQSQPPPQLCDHGIVGLGLCSPRLRKERDGGALTYGQFKQVLSCVLYWTFGFPSLFFELFFCGLSKLQYGDAGNGFIAIHTKSFGWLFLHFPSFLYEEEVHSLSNLMGRGMERGADGDQSPIVRWGIPRPNI